MPQPSKYEFTYKEVATALVKQAGLHEGLWVVSMKFGIGAGFSGPSPEEALPTAMVPVISLGIQRGDKEGPLSVDASQVNPAPPSTKQLITRAERLPKKK